MVEQGAETGVRQISAPFSSRTMLKIAGILSLNMGFSVQKVVRMCYGLRLPELESEYVLRLCNDIFGHDKNVLKKTQVNDLDHKIVSKAINDIKEDSQKTTGSRKKRQAAKTSRDKDEEKLTA